MWTVFVGFSPADDGIRHLVHFNDGRTWGEIFPHTIFRHFHFDPWLPWDWILHKIQVWFGIGVVQTAELVNFIMFASLGFWAYLMMRDERGFPTYFRYLLPIAAIVLGMRYYIVRPDMLSGIYVLFAVYLIVKRKGAVALFLLGAVYAPLYYVSWFYIGHITLLLLLLRRWKEAAAAGASALVGIGYYLWLGGEGFLELMRYVIAFGELRRELGVHVMENVSLFNTFNAFKMMLGDGVTSAILMLLAIVSVWRSRYLQATPLAAALVLFLPVFLTQSRFTMLLAPLYLVGVFILANEVYRMHMFERRQEYMGVLLLAGIIFSLISMVVEVLSLNQKQHTISHHLSRVIDGDGKFIAFSMLNGYVYDAMLYMKKPRLFPCMSLESFDGDISHDGQYARFLRGDMNGSEACRFVKSLGADYFVAIHTEGAGGQSPSEFDTQEIVNGGCELIESNDNFQAFKTADTNTTQKDNL